MAWDEFAEVVGIALAVSVAVGLVCVGTLALLRHTRLYLQLAVVALAGVLSIVGSMIWIADRMYLSEHDLTVGVNVAIVAGVIAVAVSSLLAVFVARSSRNLASAARRIAEGDVITAPPADSAELARLADQLADTSERLRDAREREARAEASRRELVAWISHDLRTPLSGIRAMAEALDDGMVDDPSRYLQRMRERVEHVSAMVDDLFELSRIDSGTLRLDLQEVSLLDVVSDTVADLRSVAPDHPVRLDSDLTGELVVRIDPRELSRAVANLVVNALQHTPPGTEVTVRVELSGDRPTIAVIDSGGGIAEEDAERLFEPGWRGSAARTQASPEGMPVAGAGLGLAIVRGIATAHRGDIAVRNIADGCRFDLRLPPDAVLSA